ncbi:MAG: hypothetical protein ACOC93_02565, partial [Planctomycetota bacterium]
LSRAGYSPWGMSELLEKYYQQWRSDPEPLAALLEMHPVTLKRIKLSKVRVEVDYSYFDPDAPGADADEFAAVLQELSPPPAEDAETSDGQGKLAANQ